MFRASDYRAKVVVKRPKLVSGDIGIKSLRQTFLGNSLVGSVQNQLILLDDRDPGDALVVSKSFITKRNQTTSVALCYQDRHILEVCLLIRGSACRKVGMFPFRSTGESAHIAPDFSR